MMRLEPTDILDSYELYRKITDSNNDAEVFPKVINRDRLREIIQDLSNNFFVNGNDQALSEIKERFGVLLRTDNDDDRKFNESLNSTIKNIDEIQKEARKKE